MIDEGNDSSHYDKTVSIYDRISNRNVLNIKENIYKEKFNDEIKEDKKNDSLLEKTIEKIDEDSYDKTVGIFSRFQEKNDEDKTLSLFSSYKNNDEKEIFEENSNNDSKRIISLEDTNDIDIIKYVEMTREELLEDNELLVDIGKEEKLFIEIPKNITDTKKIILKGLGNKNPKTGKKGDLTIQIIIIDQKKEVQEWNKNEVNYDYILFVGKTESLNDNQKIMMIDNNKIIVPLDDKLSDFQIFDLVYKNENKNVLLVKTKTRQLADKLNASYYQASVYLSRQECEDDTYKIVKYNKKEIPIKIPKSNKDSFLLLGKDADQDEYFKILVKIKNRKYMLKKVFIYIIVFILIIIGITIL